MDFFGFLEGVEDKGGGDGGSGYRINSRVKSEELEDRSSDDPIFQLLNVLFRPVEIFGFRELNRNDIDQLSFGVEGIKEKSVMAYIADGSATRQF